jgi:alkylated DNA repair dioxygenase AlkB
MATTTPSTSQFAPEVKDIPVGGGVSVRLISGEIANPDDWFRSLATDLAWTRVDKTPRDEYFASDIGLPYTYGKNEGERTYEPSPWNAGLRWLQKQAEFWTRAAGQPKKLEVVFLNKYNDGKDQLGWHADNSPEMDDARPIVIISFGAERDIWFRQNPSDDPLNTDTPEIAKVSLPNGSICIMPPGMQNTHQHRIPRSSLNVCGPRISLTFRGYVKLKE